MRQLKGQEPLSKVSTIIVTGPAKGIVCGPQVFRCPFSVFDSNCLAFSHTRPDWFP